MWTVLRTVIVYPRQDTDFLVKALKTWTILIMNLCQIHRVLSIDGQELGVGESRVTAEAKKETPMMSKGRRGSIPWTAWWGATLVDFRVTTRSAQMWYTLIPAINIANTDPHE